MISRTNDEQLFGTEADFVHWLVTLMASNAEFSDISIDGLLRRSGSREERHMRADILARRGETALIIECKNRPLFGGAVDEVIAQLVRYGAARPGVQLVLALPGRLAELDVARLRQFQIELWDADAIGHMFSSQLGASPAHIAAAFTPSGSTETPTELLLRELRDCEPGKPQWSVYQQLVGRILEHLFCPDLNVPLSESPDESGTNRRDFILANFAEAGFWNHMRQRYAADYIVVDAKNYVGKIKKREILQMANYLRPHGAGLFGMIFTRVGADASARITAREQWAHYQKLVLILDDSDCTAMLNASGAGGATAVLTRVIQDFRLSM